MIYFLYGADTFRARLKLEEITSRYQSMYASGMSLMRLDIDMHDFDDFRNAAEAVSMFPEKKLIIVTNACAKSAFKEKFIRYAKETSIADAKDVMVIFFEGDLPSREYANDPFFTTLLKIAKTQQFSFLGPGRIKSWAAQRIKEKGIRMRKRAFEKFITYVGSDTWRIENELEKLKHWRGGDAVSEGDIDLLIAPPVETNIFRFTDAFAARDKRRALALLSADFAKGQEDAYIVAVLASAIRNIILAKDALAARRSPAVLEKTFRMHPYVIQKSIAAAKHFTLEELKKIHRELFEVELDIKLGRRDPRAALEVMIARL